MVVITLDDGKGYAGVAGSLGANQDAGVGEQLRGDVIALMKIQHEEVLSQFRVMAELLQSGRSSADQCGRVAVDVGGDSGNALEHLHLPAIKEALQDLLPSWLRTEGVPSQGSTLAIGSADLEATDAEVSAVAHEEEQHKHWGRSLSNVFAVHAQTKSGKQRAEDKSAEITSYHPRPVSPMKSRLQRIVFSFRFEVFCGLAIVTNAILTGVEAQHTSEHVGQMPPYEFELLQHIYAIVFFAELILRISAVGCREFYSNNFRWGLLDTFIVGVGMLELLLDIALWIASSHGAGDDFAGASHYRIIRLIRITRLARAFRIQRIIRLVTSLRVLVDSIFATLRSLIWALILLWMIIYVFAVSITQTIVEELPEIQESDGALAGRLVDYWGSVDASMMTLFQAISGGESWRYCYVPLQNRFPITSALLTVYIAFTYFAVLNVLTGVFCSGAIEATQRNPEIIAMSLAKDKKVEGDRVRALFRDCAGTDGAINIEELQDLLSNPQLQAYLSAMGIEPEDAWTLFKLIDVDTDQLLDIDEFLTGCQRLKGSASAINVAVIKYDLHVLGLRLNRFMSSVEDKLHITSHEQKQQSGIKI